LDIAHEGKGDDNPPFQPPIVGVTKIRIASIGEENQERRERGEVERRS
jgi:hypothetical protein